MKKSDITKAVNNNLCFSCGACSVVCHTDCINFKITNSGRLVPIIDYDKCTNCGGCFNICPGIDEKYRINHNRDLFEGEVVNAYLGKTNNKEIYLNSQSGGMATEVLSYLFNKKLIKYALAVKMDYSFNPKPTYFLAKNLNDLKTAQKSIYLPVNILEVFKNIKEIDGDIAIVGVGCQIQGLEELKKYKSKIYNKIIYKLGLICDRSLSYLTNEFFKEKNIEYKIIYRDNLNPDYLNANVSLERKDKTKKTIDRSIRFFLKDLTTPSRCYICADKMNINADFVFGDPWGIEWYDKENGESVVVTRNKKAEQIIQEIIKEKRASLKKIDYKDVLKGQNIEKRKEKVFKSLAIYKKYGYKIPSYYRDYKIPTKIDRDLEKRLLYIWKMKKRNKFINILDLKIRVYTKFYFSKLKQTVKRIIIRRQK